MKINLLMCVLLCMTASIPKEYIDGYNNFTIKVK